jgi:plastocyanin
MLLDVRIFEMAGRPLVLSLLLAGALAVPAVAAARPFYGTVAAPPTITLKKASGANVTHASPGSRKFVISDQSSFHNFHLLGPGVSKKTGIDFVGSRTWTVTLQVGTYKFRCDAHPKTMRGSFNVS